VNFRKLLSKILAPTADTALTYYRYSRQESGTKQKSDNNKGSMTEFLKQIDQDIDIDSEKFNIHDEPKVDPEPEVEPKKQRKKRLPNTKNFKVIDVDNEDPDCPGCKETLENPDAVQDNLEDFETSIMKEK
jgi:hypothetical protein